MPRSVLPFTHFWRHENLWFLSPRVPASREPPHKKEASPPLREGQVCLLPPHPLLCSQNDTLSHLVIVPGRGFLVSEVVPVSSESSRSISSGDSHTGDSSPAGLPLRPQTSSPPPCLLSPPSAALPKVTSDILSANAVTFSQSSSCLTFLSVSHHRPSPVCLFGNPFLLCVSYSVPPSGCCFSSPVFVAPLSSPYSYT